MTSYTRPTSSFAPENSGRPVGLKAGLLSAADLRAPSASVGGGPVPMASPRAGMLGQGKGADGTEEITLVRIVACPDVGSGKAGS